MRSSDAGDVEMHDEADEPSSIHIGEVTECGELLESEIVSQTNTLKSDAWTQTMSGKCYSCSKLSAQLRKMKQRMLFYKRQIESGKFRCHSVIA